MCSGMSQRSRKAWPRSALREHDADVIAAALPVEGRGVELADQAGAEHRDLVGLHRVAASCGGGRRGAAAADEVAAGDERLELGGGEVAGGLAEAAVGDEGQALRRDAGREDRVDPRGDLLGGLDVAVLDVDHARRDVLAGVGDLVQEVDLAHLAVRELEDQLVDVEAEHRLQDRPVRPRRERPAEEVAEAEMGAEPDVAADRLDRGVEQRREVRRGVGMDRRRRLVDLDDRRAGVAQPAELAWRIATKASAAATRVA